MKPRVDMAAAAKLVDTVRVLTLNGATPRYNPDRSSDYTVRTKAFRSVIYFPPNEPHRFLVRIVVGDRDVFRAHVYGPKLEHVETFRRGKWEQIVLMSSPIDREAGHA